MLPSLRGLADRIDPRLAPDAAWSRAPAHGGAAGNPADPVRSLCEQQYRARPDQSAYACAGGVVDRLRGGGSGGDLRLGAGDGDSYQTIRGFGRALSSARGKMASDRVLDRFR